MDKPVQGPQLNQDISLEDLLEGYKGLGGQATELWNAAQLLIKLRQLRDSEDPNQRPFIYFGYTSNMISSGLREVIRYMAEHKLVDAIITTGGGIEEDFMKCFENAFVIDYIVNDREMRLNGENRIGNMLVPNNNYMSMERWMEPILEEAHSEQKKTGLASTPSSLISLMGSRIDNNSSVYHHCYHNSIPVFCPGITDGAVGDNIFFNAFKVDNFMIDIMKDMISITDLADTPRPTAAIILGGGIVKYHAINACRAANNPLKYVVNFNWGYEGDCSYSGAKISQDATTSGVRTDAEIVNVGGDASLGFLLASCFAYGKFRSQK